MLPYVELPSLGPINSFGILAVLGMFFATAALMSHAERLGLDLTRVRRMAAFCGIGGLLGAHYVDLLLYQPGWAGRDDALWRFLNPFAGISSFGGLFGGAIGFALFARSCRGERMRYAEAAALGTVVFLVFGRAGCASVHDHVGIATDFALAVDFPRGNPVGVVGPHHDLGLYELALFAVLAAASMWLLRKPRRPGLYLGIVAIGYAVPRFGFDMLRREVDNPRYASLTPAQWGCIAMVGIGVALLVYCRRQPPPECYAAGTPWRAYLRDQLRWRPRLG